MTSRERENRRRRYATALGAVYAGATDAQRAYGAEWYAQALHEARAISSATGVPLSNVVGAIAALSPRNQWRDNLNDAALLCDWYADEGMTSDGERPFDDVQRHLHAFRTNSAKALECLYRDPLDVLRGPKERAFYRNIMGDADAVTVDVWATRAATRSALDTPGGAAHYADIASACRRTARKAGVAPRDFQAAVWLALRDLTSNGNSGGGGWAARRAAA